MSGEHALSLDLSESGGKCIEEPLVRFAILISSGELDGYSNVELKVRRDLLNPDIVIEVLRGKGFECALEEESRVVFLRCKKVDNPTQIGK